MSRAATVEAIETCGVVGIIRLKNPSHLPGVVQALAAGERDVPRVAVLPLPVGLERLALEVADVDVVQERLDLERHLVAAGERDRRRLARAREATCKRRTALSRALRARA